MTNNHRFGSVIFGVVFGVAAAAWAYHWISDPQKIEQRQAEERAVLHAREVLADRLSLGELQIVDPLATDRKVGKAYVYPTANGWDVSGYYRRDDNDAWHAYLMSMTSELVLQRLKVDDDDPALLALAATDPQIEVSR